MQDVLKYLHTAVVIPFCRADEARPWPLKPDTGILLHGPPGCGKSTLARAIANEVAAQFYEFWAPGATEENIRELFSEARRTAPAVVHFEDIDAMASKSENLRSELDCRIATQLRRFMESSFDAKSDSSDEKSCFVLVIGSTTKRLDVIDPVLEIERFDREFEIGIPNENARLEILSVLTRDCKLDASVDLLRIARSTPGFVGADLHALVRKAGTEALRRNFLEHKSKLPEDLVSGQMWWKEPVPPVEIEKWAIVMADFEEAIKSVHPSTRMEGFSSIPNVKWEDVGGLDSIRHKLDFHVGQVKFAALGQHFEPNMGTAILLFGPPGCGKTLIAQAVANECGANFFHVRGPELLIKYDRESAAAVKTLFIHAQACLPCIIFFDEVDALTICRGKHCDAVVWQILDQLGTELESLHGGIVVIGATERPEVMDPAILRNGRFGRRLYVAPPSSDDRGLILKALAKRKRIDPSVDLCAIGRMEQYENFSSADLKELMMEAALAARKESRYSSSDLPINTSHFLQVQGKVSPSVSPEVVEKYKLWSENFKRT